MSRTLVNNPKLLDFLAELDEAFAEPGAVFLIGETTHVLEGWRPWSTQIELTPEVDPAHRAAFEAAATEIAGRMDFDLIIESPADLIPLPEGYQERAVPVPEHVYAGQHLKLLHFDPYSVAYRFIARGDEPDYHIVLMLLDKGWVTKAEMDTRLAALLPAFTSESIQQDPAEFRRKYKGLTQMWNAHRPMMNHRFTGV
jgi:hypothetical protein